MHRRPTKTSEDRALSRAITEWLDRLSRTGPIQSTWRKFHQAASRRISCQQLQVCNRKLINKLHRLRSVARWVSRGGMIKWAENRPSEASSMSARRYYTLWQVKMLKEPSVEAKTTLTPSLTLRRSWSRVNHVVTPLPLRHRPVMLEVRKVASPVLSSQSAELLETLKPIKTILRITTSTILKRIRV